MASARLPLLLGVLALATGCGEDAPPLMGTSGSSGAGGAQAGNGPGGGAGAGGSGTAGSLSTAGKAGSGGSAPQGGQGGLAGQGGGTSGSGGNGGGSAGASGGGGPLAPNYPPVKSAGCDKAPMLTSGSKTIMSSNRQRGYTIDIPDDYDMSRPYRFIFASHWIGSRDDNVVNQGYYHLKPKADEENDPAIFLAPQAGSAEGPGTWSTNSDIDHVFFDDLLALVKESLCIDTTRVFAIGFSYGGMQTWSLSVNHQKDIRAAVGIAPANWNIYVPEKTHEPIAWMQTTGMSDGTCKWVNNDGREEGAKYIALEHAEDNGCTLPAGGNVPTWQNGEFFCYDFEGCPAGYPTKACTFDGGHTSTDFEPWIAVEAWKFFKQF
jgi:poly(3-hydroxybutyrate) depolymerase